ncbi:NADH-ubiquinone oxidoreductase chain N [Fulvivirga imtechensis AK7]|uniref:NADH-quinone oxidoreductase subunit N n=1 Tax=Fulvivirga imtechensis AK7 TaxID=1237149 RepID=L8JT52_9BACT|nr:NADH-quinone oxidoreductase subunit N [Fulvivirga imtechensis]ELR70532.1 NADH-ubiquinone oxidoreductase chain N [Fulvivirga imtechensis AK7]
MEEGLHHKLTGINSSLPYFLPEVILVGGIILIVFVGLFNIGKKELLMRVLAAVMLALVLYFDIRQWLHEDNVRQLFLDMVTLDRAAILWKILFGTGGLFTVLMGFKYRGWYDKSGEYYALMLSVVFGAHLVAMASNLLMIFIGIEVISISSYILTTFSFNKNSTEAGLKYLLFGAAASGVMIFGMSWLYAFTGSLAFTEQSFLEMLMKADALPLIIASLFVTAGLLFKISAAPMHIWAPDVYTSAPTPVVAFFSIVPKLAGFAILVRWMLVIKLFGFSPVDWAAVLAVVAMLTIAIGNFSALWQNNAKRMLAYSSIAHSGFLLIGLVAFSELAIQSLLFYAAIYILMNVAAFIYVSYLEREYNIINIKDYKGFVRTSPLIATVLVVIMISLTGLPPTAGFTAKLLIFSALWDGYAATDHTMMLYLLIFGLLNAVVSLFYYLKIPYFMIFKEGAHEGKAKKLYTIENFLGFFMVLALLILFFKPDGLMRMINSVSFAF